MIAEAIDGFYWKLTDGANLIALYRRNIIIHYSKIVFHYDEIYPLAPIDNV